MAIQFTCSKCQNPIEVDDEFANQMATCPYCRAVLKVPSISTLDDQQPIDARPLQPTQNAPGAPPQPVELSSDSTMDAGQPDLAAKSRNWGYASIALAVFALVVSVMWMFSIAVQAASLVPGIEQQTDPFDPELNRQVQAAAHQVATQPAFVMTAIGTLALGLVAVIVGMMGVRSKATWQAMIGVVLGVISITCIGCFSTSFWASGPTRLEAPDANAPAEVQPSPSPSSETEEGPELAQTLFGQINRCDING